jgi:hypothetical protein
MPDRQIPRMSRRPKDLRLSHYDSIVTRPRLTIFVVAFPVGVVSYLKLETVVSPCMNTVQGGIRRNSANVLYGLQVAA